MTIKIDMNIPGVEKALRDAVWGAAMQTAQAVEQDIKGGGPHSIAVSQRDGNGRWVASDPGEPPHLRTGNLRRSYHVEYDAAKLSAQVGSDSSIAPYAQFVELGTRHMAARPHLLPAMTFQTPLFAQRIVAALGKMAKVIAPGEK